ncbi:hypothetical protein HGP17_01060 [Rhizobium sp. P38BS-XIX]|uniref:hypothetical protein n=1 Tax=Rhizobium sp. P38BS-XIX TaxID=2726740 RepID=UPI0014570DC0|nr:hypothetical protein [Rhizobium sp. P38BS-XIX]NLR95420.1 hypothetical protein [Rhizobium sp. P38BS-XIX]
MLARLIALLLLCPTSALAADWWSYDNAGLGYAIELPPEFHLSDPSNDTDRLSLSPADRSAVLQVFGTAIGNGDFTTEANGRVALAKDQGWKISYSKSNSRGISFSGTKQGRIVYVRGVALCNGGAAFFQMDYSKTDMQRYDAIVMRLARSLRSTRKCTPTAQVIKSFPVTG